MPKGDAKTILVVDDDQDLLALVALMLKMWGYRPVMASNGREALERLEIALPHLILLDMNMPVMNGAEFAKEVCTRYGRQIPIIVMTAAEDARRRAKEIEADGWIGKPFDLTELRDGVTKLIRGD